MVKEMFPRTIAHGYSFCNRTDEQEILLGHINSGNHVVLIAPRRYGKSSLSHQVTERWISPQSKRMGVGISLYSAYDESAAVQLIVTGAQKAINKIMPLMPDMEAIQKFLKSFSGLGFEAGLKTDGIGFGIKFDLERKSAKPLDITSIGAILTKMDDLAHSLGWKIVFEMDEFQEIASLKHGKSIEAQIRDAVQFSVATSYIFLGSNRHMLEQMFTDSSRPFFSMCHSIRLNRIEAVHYQKHIGDASRVNWNTEMDIELLDLILSLTERHPFYVNSLCHELWKQEKVPVRSDVLDAWRCVVEDRVLPLRSEFSHLSATQKAILNNLADEPEKQITSISFITKLLLPTTTIKDGFRQLQNKDLVYMNDNGAWAVMDPCLAYDLRNQRNPQEL